MFVLSASARLLNLNQDQPLKKTPYKIEFVITFLIEMLELPNFCHMNTAII